MPYYGSQWRATKRRTAKVPMRKWNIRPSEVVLVTVIRADILAKVDDNFYYDWKSITLNRLSTAAGFCVFTPIFQHSHVVARGIAWLSYYDSLSVHSWHCDVSNPQVHKRWEGEWGWNLCLHSHGLLSTCFSIVKGYIWNVYLCICPRYVGSAAFSTVLLNFRKSGLHGCHISGTLWRETGNCLDAINITSPRYELVFIWVIANCVYALKQSTLISYLFISQGLENIKWNATVMKLKCKFCPFIY